MAQLEDLRVRGLSPAEGSSYLCSRMPDAAETRWYADKGFGRVLARVLSAEI